LRGNMTPEEFSVKLIFDLQGEEPWVDNIPDKLFFLSKKIPGSNYFCRLLREYKKLGEFNKSAAEYGFKEEKKGNQLYLITDDGSIIHFFAMDKRYEPVVNKLNYIFNLDMLDPTYAEFFEEEG